MQKLGGFCKFPEFFKTPPTSATSSTDKRAKKVSPVLWDTLYVYIRQAIHCHRNYPLNSKSMIPNITAAADPFVTADGNSLDSPAYTPNTINTCINIQFSTVWPLFSPKQGILWNRRRRSRGRRRGRCRCLRDLCHSWGRCRGGILVRHTRSRVKVKVLSK